MTLEQLKQACAELLAWLGWFAAKQKSPNMTQPEPPLPVIPPVKQRETGVQAPQTPTPAFPPMIIKWATAISHWEGGPDDTNPGDLKFSPLTETWGAVPGIKAADGGYLAHFKDIETGYTALCNFLILGCHDELKAYHHARTLDAFMTVYGGNPPLGYRQGIAHELGMPLDTDISTFLV